MVRRSSEAKILELFDLAKADALGSELKKREEGGSGPGC